MMLIQPGPIGLVCLLTAKACGAAHVIITGEQCVTVWGGGWGLFVIYTHSLQTIPTLHPTLLHTLTE